MDVETAHVPEISGRFQPLAERRRARRERTVGGSDPLWNLGKLLTRLRNGKTLAQRVAEGEELNGEAIGLDFPLDPEFMRGLVSRLSVILPLSGNHTEVRKPFATRTKPLARRPDERFGRLNE